MMRVPVACALVAAALGSLATSCARPAGSPAQPTRGSAAPQVDSVTVALWRLNEAGSRRCADLGPRRLTAIAGLDTRTEFGRFGSARVFISSIESWLYVPFDPAFNTPRLTAEAWIEPTNFGNAELSVIVARWTEHPNEQSWLLGLSGRQIQNRFNDPATPGYFERSAFGVSAGRLIFVYQPDDATPAQSFSSVSEIFLDRWTHVAVTVDGEVVRLYLDGTLDAQYVVRGGVRASPAPVMIGNYFDARKLSDFSGDFSTGGRITHPPVYSFIGAIDEVRISSEARTSFESVR